MSLLVSETAVLTVGSIAVMPSSETLPGAMYAMIGAKMRRLYCKNKINKTTKTPARAGISFLCFFFSLKRLSAFCWIVERRVFVIVSLSVASGARVSAFRRSLSLFARAFFSFSVSMYCLAALA